MENTQFDIIELKQRLQRLESRIAAQEKDAAPKNPSRLRWVWVAVAFVCMGALGLFSYRSASDNRLFRGYYQPYPNVVAFAERGSASSVTTDAALQSYEQGYYGEALAGFEKSYRNGQTAAYTFFYAGVACIETGQLEKAEQFLVMATQQPDTSFAAQSRWYLALVHVKKNERKKAAACLTALTRSSEAYREKAQRLLNEL